jgi:hypothetical protein
MTLEDLFRTGQKARPCKKGDDKHENRIKNRVGKKMAD